jgi:hypothetical protein
LGKTIALHFEIVRFLKKPALYTLKTLNFKLTFPSLGSDRHLLLFISVPDTYWTTDPDPALFYSGFQNAKKKIIFFPSQSPKAAEIKVFLGQSRF